MRCMASRPWWARSARSPSAFRPLRQRVDDAVDEDRDQRDDDDGDHDLDQGHAARAGDGGRPPAQCPAPGMAVIPVPGLAAVDEPPTLPGATLPPVADAPGSAIAGEEARAATGW